MAQHRELGQALGPLAADIASGALALARRFASGATLWCWAPNAAGHAQHVAVEFVHPVIMGKRAFPAVAVDVGPPEALDVFRSSVRAGDVILVVAATGDDDGVIGVLRRARSWGATTIWIGGEDRPAAGAADHVLSLGGDPAMITHDGRLVLVYHLLWELTQVCIEHPGLLQEGLSCEGPSCITCSDEGRLGEVLQARDATATVRTATGTEEIDTTVIGGVQPGDLLLVHAGTALTIVDERS